MCGCMSKRRSQAAHLRPQAAAQATEPPIPPPAPAVEPPAVTPEASRARRTIPWTLAALVTVLCVYRPWHVALQPQDAPGTLRWLLWPLYDGFIRLFPDPNAAASGWVVLCAVLLSIPVLLVVVAQYYATSGRTIQGRTAAFFGSRKLFMASVAAGLLVCRFPILLGWAFNPDEDDFLALAHKLLVDPVIYRSVDTYTSGPLVVYPLNLPAVFGLTPDYASARIVSLLLVLASLYLVLLTVRLISSEVVARASILPAVVFFAVLTHADFISYSSEMAPLLLVSLAIFAAARVIHKPGAYGMPLLCLGALVIAGFFAKAQCLPIVVAAGAVAMLSLYRDGLRSFGGPGRVRFWRPAGLYVAGTIPPALVAVTAISAAGAWHDWWISYIRWNFEYTRAGGNLLQDLESLAGFLLDLREVQLLFLSLLTLLACSVYLLVRGSPRRVWLPMVEVLAIGGVTAGLAIRFAPADPMLTDRWGLPAACLLGSGGAMALLVVHDFLRDRALAWPGVLTLVVLAGGVFSIFSSHNQFPHYLVLLTVPVCTSIGWLLARHREKATGLAVMAMFLAVAIGEGYDRGYYLRDIFLHVPPATQALDGPLIRKLTPSNGNLFVWGWFESAYLASARPMATRDPHIQVLFCCNDDLIPQFRDRFLRDLRAHPADLFLDALDVSCCYMNDRKVYGFETVPAIRSYVDANYLWVSEQFRQRFYLRRDLAAIPRPRACDAGAVFCYQAASVYGPAPPPLRMPEHARLEADFTPLDAGDAVTIFGTDPASAAGFRFIHTGHGMYRLVAGGAASQEVALPEGQHVSLAIDFNGTAVTLSCNGEVRDRLTLDHPLTGADVQIAAAGWKGYRYAAALDRVQIRVLPR